MKEEEKTNDGKNLEKLVDIRSFSPGEINGKSDVYYFSVLIEIRRGMSGEKNRLAAVCLHICRIANPLNIH